MDTLKHKAGQYIIQHYLGQYLQDKISLDQLEINLRKGTGTVKDVLLDVNVSTTMYAIHVMLVELLPLYMPLQQMTTLFIYKYARTFVLVRVRIRICTRIR